MLKKKENYDALLGDLEVIMKKFVNISINEWFLTHKFFKIAGSLDPLWMNRWNYKRCVLKNKNVTICFLIFIFINELRDKKGRLIIISSLWRLLLKKENLPLYKKNEWNVKPRV